MLRAFLAAVALAALVAGAGAAGDGSNAPWRLGSSLVAPPEIPEILPPPDAGATFPVVYDISAFDATVGTLRYIAPSGTGNDANACTLSLPCLTLSRAQSVASSGDAIVCRDGIYRTNDLSITKSLYITAYTGEVCEFRGSQVVTAAFNSGTVEGAYRYIAYTEQPIDNGHANFVGGENITGGTGGVGQLVDQMFIGDCLTGPYTATCGELQQVATKAAVAAGKFWVDRTNHRMYAIAADATSAFPIEITQQDNFMSISAANVALRGIKVTRYSPSGADYGAVDVNLVDGFRCDNSEFSNISTEGLFLNGNGSDQVDGSVINFCTFRFTGYFPMDSTYDFHTTVAGVKGVDNDWWDEFSGSPGSGFKFTHSHYMDMTGSEMRNNKSHGVWCDQSCYKWVVGSNQITGNLNTGFFYELSDDLLLINNIIQTTGSASLKFGGGSTGLRAMNNTFVNGTDTVGIYMEKRSVAMCADKTVSPNPSANWTTCSTTYGVQDSDRVAPAVWHNTIDWLPRVDEFWNNILAWPTAAGLCGGLVTPLCITDNNTGTQVAAGTILHPAEPARSIPQTFWDYNVYASNSGRVAALPNTTNNTSISYATRAALSAALSTTPYSILGQEANGLDAPGLVNADGSPTAALIALESSARAMPTDAAMNRFIPPGTQCFGVAYDCGP